MATWQTPVAEGVDADFYNENRENEDQSIPLNLPISPNELTLSITTRGIGMSICNLVMQSRAFPKISMPDDLIYASYRVSLGLLEQKLSELRIFPRSGVYEYCRDVDFRSYAQTFRVPAKLQHLINSVGIFEHNGVTYYPGVAKDETGNGRPRPENLLLSNLRSTVELLSDSATPLAYRKYFHDHNPIPGAQWNDESLLLNPNEIIPENYNNRLVCNLLADNNTFNNYLSCFWKYDMPEFTPGLIDLKSNGNKLLLISNKMGTLKVPDRNIGEDVGSYCAHCFPKGTIDSYYCLANNINVDHEDDNILMGMGMNSLLGECPEPDYCTDPIYDLRHENVSPFIVPATYRGLRSNNMVHGALTLSVTTRGIGLSLCRLAHLFETYNTPMPDIKAFYRVCLGILEIKLANIRPPCLPVAIIDSYRYEMNADLKLAAEGIFLPKAIQCLINAVGVFEHNGITYVPAVAKDTTNNSVPQPENLLLSNLRRTVDLLSNPETPVAHRKYFYEHNPIPGAQWNKDEYLLLNADDIIYADYHVNLVNNFRNDAREFESYLIRLQRHSYLPEFAFGRVNFTSNGRKCLLLSNTMGTLKVPDRGIGEDLSQYYKRCQPEGDTMHYYALSEVGDYDILLGACSLLGESPDPDSTDPVYSLRRRSVSAFSVPFNTYRQLIPMLDRHCIVIY